MRLIVIKCSTCSNLFEPDFSYSLFICEECTALRPILNDDQLKILEGFIKAEREK